ncbi:hypothetical protein PSTT_09021 [Puccinia striiformis]|uniref:RNase H type-1 domain-containing protein n=1 Tax=Puccinia striiformis TaxID=27350 RepID=A0A2S4VA32_9BASI|nr:hypothetical protein PSTT_09021 [Puccinia striiformis]
MEARFDSLDGRIAQLESTRPPPVAHQAHPSKSSYARAVGTSNEPRRPQINPPARNSLQVLKPGKAIIHSNPDHDDVRKLERGFLVQRANEVLAKLDAQVQGEKITIKAAQVLKSGDVCFFSKNHAQQKWLMENKHRWTKDVHAHLEASPSSFMVIAHGIPKDFDPTSQASIDKITVANNFGAGDLVRMKWLADNSTTPKQAGSIVLAFRNKETAARVEKTGIYLNWDHHRASRFIPRPPQCFKCLKMGHFGQWCREPARCDTTSITTNLPSFSSLSLPHPPLTNPPLSNSSPHLSPSGPSGPSDTSSSSTFLLQLNCHVSKTTTLSVLNSSPSFLLLALQEPWVDHDSFLPPNHKDWILFSAHEHKPVDFHDRHRVCIYVRKSLGASAVNQLSTGGKFLLGLDITLRPNLIIRLINVYNTPRSFPALTLLRSWLDSFNDRSIPSLICIDGNLHHPHWNPPEVTSRHAEARSLLETTGKHGFRLASPKQVPTFYSSTGKGFTLDLTWSNFLGSKIVNSISISENNHSSDHQALIISLSVRLATTPLKIIQPNWKKIVPEKAKLSTQHLINQLNLPVSGSVDNQVKRITEILLQSQLKLSKRINSEGSRSKGWWNSEKLDPIVDSRNRARKWFILSRSPEAAECYRQWNFYFKSTVAQLKRKSWWDFLKKSSDESLFKALRFTKKAGSNGILPLRRPDRSLTTDKAEQAKLLFYGTSVVSAPIDMSDVPPRVPSRIVCFPELSVAEVRAGIQRIRPKKAPGIDGIANELIKLFPSEISSAITATFNQALADSSFPSSWKCAVTAIIRKGGKDDYTDSHSYRPIALLSSLGKLFGLLIARQLTSWAEDNGILAEGHLGGRKGAGTEDAMVLLDTWIRHKWNQGKVVAGLFLDVKSAYPSVHPRRLIRYLSSLGCPAYLVGIIESFLENRQTTIRIDDFVSPPFDIGIGLPQGSPLSVILYIIYNNELLTKEFSLASDKVSIGYVDDVVHLVAAKNPTSAHQELGKEGERSLSWGRRYGAIFDKKKAQFMWFSRKPPPTVSFTLGDQVLTRAEEVKWLGILLDPKLSYSATFDMLTGKLHATFSQLKPLGNSRWGLNETDRVRLMSIVLLPRLTYGAPVWATKINAAKIRTLSDKADNKAAIYSLGTFKSTPVKWHRLHSSVRPIAEGIVMASLSFFLRKKSKISKSRKIQDLLFARGVHCPPWLAPHAPVSRPYLCEVKTDGIEEIKVQYSPDLNYERLKKCYLNFTSSKEEAKAFVEQQVSISTDSRRSLRIFTDGSYEASRGGAGAAVCIEHNVCRMAALGVSPFISNHESEAVGLQLAFEIIKSISSTESIREVFIFTDNRGVLERMANPGGAKPGQYLFTDILSLWRSLDTDILINFVWCPGHQGILGNEVADRLADAATRLNSTPDQTLPFSLSKVSAFLKSRISPTPKKSLSKRTSSLPIHQSAILNQLDSGHSPLHYYLFKSKRRLDPVCPFCPAKETTQHYLDLCPALKVPRKTLVTAARRLKIKFPTNRPHLLLRFSKAHPLIFDFISDSRRFRHL